MLSPHHHHELLMTALTAWLILSVAVLGIAAAPWLLRTARRTARRIEQAVEQVAIETERFFRTTAPGGEAPR